ncbi:MAG TPA: M42 family metallopeptidase [Thermoanaerobaculia bacterium]|nr:M42 family metallopeptidase [Thermoanaerobaculia bacterium]
MIDQKSRSFLDQLLVTPSPSGYEQQVQALVRDFAREYADEVRTDLHGNVIAARNPGGRPRILLDGHCDHIGLMVQHVDDAGFVYVQTIGGWDLPILLGRAVVVWTKDGPQRGVIGRKPTHLLSEEDRKKMPKITDLWVDLGAASADEVKRAVRIGDPVTVELGVRELPNRRLSGPKLDNTAGLFVVLEALKRLSGKPFDAALFVVSAVQEEIGLRGATTAAHGVDPEVGIGVDVTHATDCPTIDRREHGTVDLGKGPVLFRGPNVNPVLHDQLCELARSRSLPYQVKGAPRGTPNDANVLQLTRSGVATAAIGIPNRYMHTPVEIVSLDDIDTAAELVAALVETTVAGASFTP